MDEDVRWCPGRRGGNFMQINNTVKRWKKTKAMTNERRGRKPDDKNKRFVEKVIYESKKNQREKSQKKYALFDANIWLQY